MAELGKEEDPVAEHGHRAKLAELLAPPAVITGGFVDNRHRHSHFGCSGRRRKEEVEIGFLHIAVNEGNRFGLGECESEICGYHTFTSTAFPACNYKSHVVFPVELIGIFPARGCFLYTFP